MPAPTLAPRPGPRLPSSQHRLLGHDPLHRELGRDENHREAATGMSALPHEVEVSKTGMPIVRPEPADLPQVVGEAEGFTPEIPVALAERLRSHAVAG